MNIIKRTYYFILSALIIFVVSCSSNQRIKEDVETMYSTTIHVLQDSMLCINIDDSFNIKEQQSLKLVVYIDSSECSSCSLDRLGEWNQYLKKYKDIKDLTFLVLLELQRPEIEYVKEKLTIAGIHAPVLVDTLSAFRRANPQIPDNKMFHTFLLDRENRIVAVGNPIINKRIETLYNQIFNNFAATNLLPKNETNLHMK